MIFNHANSGRTGNQLFALAFCFVLADALGQSPLDVVDLGRAPRDWFERLPLASHFEMVIDPSIKVTDTVRTLDQIVATCRDKNVVVEGWFERADLFLSRRDLLLELFWQDLSRVPSNKFVFHFRGGDFEGSVKEVPLQFYLTAWDLIRQPTKECRICTDDLNCTVLNQFCARTGIPKPDALATPLDDFMAMRAARVLVIPRSTFSWWAAFLSNAKVIQAVSKSGDVWPCRNLLNPMWRQIYY